MSKKPYQPKTICPVCGGELEGAWVRFHWARPFIDEHTLGHYVDEDPRAQPGPSDPLGDHQGNTPPPPPRVLIPKGLSRPARALVKKNLVPLEDNVRWAIIQYMRDQRWAVYNMEQGHRPGGGHTRVGEGIGDVYFQGFGIRGWIETKRPDPDKPSILEMQTPEQKAFEKEELLNGGTYLLVESLEQIMKWERAHRESISQTELVTI